MAFRRLQVTNANELPVGPTQPYRLMAEKINYRNLSLKNVRFFFMDEYVDDEKDELIPMTDLR